MPNMPVESIKYMGRNNPGLIRSSGDAPSEFWVTDPTLPILFEYKYTSSSNKNVVIPKGRIVAVGTPVFDRRLNRSYPALTLANGTNNPVGVAMTTIFERLPESFGGYQPTIVTRNYIQVPMLRTKALADDMAWGCAYGVAEGDFVKADAKGHFAKWMPNKIVTEAVADITNTLHATYVTKEPIKAGSTVTARGKKDGAPAADITATLTNLYTITLDTDTPGAYTEVTVTYISQLSDPIEQRVGQVLATESTTNPEGFLQYLLDDPVFQEIADSRDEYAAKTAEPSFFIGEMRYWLNRDKGVRFLTDGRIIGKEAVSKEVLKHVATDPSTFGVGYTNTGSYEIFKLANTPVSEDDLLKVEIRTTGDEAVKTLREDVDFRMDYQNGIIHVYSLTAYAGQNVCVTYSHFKSAIPGLPTELDVAGGIGAARILLKF